MLACMQASARPLPLRGGGRAFLRVIFFLKPPFDKFRGSLGPPHKNSGGGPQIAICLNSNVILFCVFAN